MVPLAIQPVVQTVDADGTAAPATTTVTVQVLSGNGAVMAGDTATTDANGRAAFSRLTLGAVYGQTGTLTLRFAAEGLEPVLATVELRCAVLPLTIGHAVNAEVTLGDCRFGSGSFANIFELTTSQPLTAVQLTADASFPSTLLVRGPNEQGYWGWVATAPQRWGFKALLSAGANRVAVGTVQLGNPGIIGFGKYSLTASAAPEDLTCDSLEAVATSPITTSQQLGTGDCLSGDFLEDRLLVSLPPSATITASMTTTAFQPRLRLIDGVTEEVMADVTGSPTASAVVASGSTSKIVLLLLSSQASGSTGPYSLSVSSIANPQAGAATDVISAILPRLRRNREPSGRHQ